MRITYFLVALIVLLVALTPGAVSGQNAIDDITITDIDERDFPQVRVRFRALDSTGATVPNLDLSAFDVFESNEPVSAAGLEEVDEGIWVHFVVDAGLGLNGERLSRARDAVLNFAQGRPWMIEGVDHVALSVVEGTGLKQLSDYTTDANDVVSAINNYAVPAAVGNSYSDPVAALDRILTSLENRSDAQEKAKFVVLLTPSIERGSGATLLELATRAREAGVPIHTVLTRESARLDCSLPPPSGDDESDQPTTSGCVDQPVVDLGELSGGSYTFYPESDQANRLFGNLTAQRVQYEVTYRSAQSDQGQRQVRVAADVGAGGVAGIGSYEVDLDAPRVLIESPADGFVIDRKSDDFIADRGAIGPTSQTVVVSVVFPDNYQRRIRRATLLVNGEVENTREALSERNFELTWNLRPIQAQGLNDFTLEVEIEDELGFVSASPPVGTQVDVFVPPAPEGSDGAPVDLDALREDLVASFEGSTGVPIIECFEFTPEPLCNAVERPVRRNPMAFTSILLSLFVVGFVYVNRNSAPVRGATQRVKTIIDKTIRYARSEPIAFLHVLEGDRSIDKKLEIYGDTAIGRSRQFANVLFHQYDANSPISRLHCRILNEEDHFRIQDEDSENGTYLNGVRLEPMVPEELHDGDEIELARIERGGVRLKFLAADDTGAGDESVTRQTRVPNTNANDDTVVDGTWSDPF